MKARSKFYGIKFPIFALKKKPYDYSIRLDNISVKRTEDDDWHTIDKYSEKTPLLHRYVSIKDEFFFFDFTCTNITQLVSKNIECGIDANAKIFDLRQKQKFKARTVQVVKTRDNLIWVDTVSYPFKLSKNILDKKTILEQYITIVYIDECWHLFRFSSFKEPVNELIL
jgi:hypothetical protein